jgi:hypothetical protein
MVHDVLYRGPGVGLTVHRQGPLEPAALNSFDGFVGYKALSREQAAEAEAMHASLASSLSDDRQVTSTILVRGEGWDPNQMEPGAMPVPSERFEELAIGAIHSLERLIKQAA